jgi:4'-phosphopantetheinyl transferase
MMCEIMRTHRITVWTVAVDAVPEELWPSLGALLDDSERARAALFFFEQHRRQYVAAHALKRLMLSALWRAPPWTLTFETAPGGKPRLGPAPGPYFNLSHCEGLVACAVSPDLELGVDVERVSGDPPLELVRSHFAPEEERWFSSLPRLARPVAFFRLWTLKEAFIKATGRGLTQPLQDFAFGFDPLHVSFRDPALGDSRAWHFEQRVIGGEHLLALAWRGGSQDALVAIREVRFEALLAANSRATWDRVAAVRNASSSPRCALTFGFWSVQGG